MASARNLPAAQMVIVVLPPTVLVRVQLLALCPLASVLWEISKPSKTSKKFP